MSTGAVLDAHAKSFAEVVPPYGLHPRHYGVMGVLAETRSLECCSSALHLFRGRLSRRSAGGAGTGSQSGASNCIAGLKHPIKLTISRRRTALQVFSPSSNFHEESDTAACNVTGQTWRAWWQRFPARGSADQHHRPDTLLTRTRVGIVSFSFLQRPAACAAQPTR